MPRLPAREPSRRPRRLRLVVAIVVVAILLAGILAVVRYGPLVGDAQAVRATAQRLAARVEALDPSDLERETIESLVADVQDMEARLDRLGSLTDDPLVQAARVIPGVATQVDAAEALVDAGGSIAEAGGIGLGLAGDVVGLRETNAVDPAFPLTSRLVELVATSSDDVDRVSQLLADADARLAAIPPDAIEPIREARDLVAGPIATYRPLLDEYRELDDVLPAILGWGGEKRYLVLAQNPAELRPAGGYTGTVGLITLRDGQLVEQRFQDVYELDLQKDLPFIEPPEELTELLLAPDDDGEPQSWRLADATWSPDFPTGARTAAEFYAIEAEGAEVDGVIAITTYALDRLLEVLGPVEVPGYDVTVEPGDVTLTLLGATRGSPSSVEGRKDVLDALATQVTERLLALPPDRWADTVGALQDIGAGRQALVWLADEEAQRAIVDLGWDGAVRQEPGDYLYVVESNVAPTSKYNYVIERADSLSVTLDEDGSALDSLRLDWQNGAGSEGEPYASLRAFSENQDGWYGAYVRVLTPTGSELVTVSGEAGDTVGGARSIGQETGRAVFANDLFMPPGSSTVTYLWTVPEAAVPTDAGWEYRLVIQKQPGARAGPLSVRVNLPTGASVLEASEGAVVDGERVRFETQLDQDVELRVLYDLPAGGGSPSAEP